MPSAPGLRSPSVKVGRLVNFGRRIDKIWLHAAGSLPADTLDFDEDRDPVSARP